MDQERADLKFDNIRYHTKKSSSDVNPILKGLSGSFYSGELTGILGSSGAGKTTLLNILAGHVLTNVKGSISINGKIIDPSDVKSISTYVRDDDLLQTSITVRESMMFVAELKLDKNSKASSKEPVAMQIIEKLNLNGCLNTMVENLSGGEKRRLSIALELISDPPILFMDEPTSGLDEVSAKQCIKLLKSLAKSGKTVICTIHQPSDIIFNMFEHVYFINNGLCVYDGLINGIVRFLDDINQPCPTHYSPSDFILEVCQSDETITNSLNQRVKSSPYQKQFKELDIDNRKEIVVKKSNRVGFLKQTGILLRRNLLQLRRRKLAMAINVGHHILSGLMTGFLYLGTGNDAAKTDNIYKLSLGAVAYISFAYAIIPILSYPFQIKVIKREISNDWYSLKAYFLTQSLIPLPYMIPLCFLFTFACFGIVDPSLGIERHSKLALILIFVAIVSHFYGHAVGALFKAQNACVIGSMVATIAMNIGAFHHYQISLPTWLIRQTSFTRYGLVGCLMTYYQDRKLDCKAIVCRHSVEQLIYDDYGLGFPSYALQVLGLALNVVFYGVCFYLILRIKFYSKAVENWKNFKAKLAK